ncbi:MAG: phosphoenolpyruvate carboxykinase (ATP) [Coriobacteriales bacterium]|nr:phosphoenolpyruvate carboxykinase (ATP) [Coriobacteriales bacterium]
MIDDQLTKCGIKDRTGAVMIDGSPAKLVERALSRREGKLTETGALSVKTGKYTGRSPEDRYIVDTPHVHDVIAWGSVNKPISQEVYEDIKAAVCEHLSHHDIFVVHALAGAQRKYTRKFTVITELASQALFCTQMLVRPSKQELDEYGDPDFIVLSAPLLKLDAAKYGIHSEAAVLINFEDRKIVIAGTQYSGEIKKSIFSVMNYLMPIEENVLPMHSSCNMDPVTGDTAVFFGLSGTGKTTLSADSSRALIGDDEHGWSDDGVFNFEGGCYAKAIRISYVTEPEIFQAIRFGAVSENVVLTPGSRVPDYFDETFTENTRVAYPIDYISNAQLLGYGGVPKVVIMLTADAFGVLPPISRLSREAAMYHFVSGFTSKVAGTERGITEPTPTFSTLFGEPFMPLDPMLYAKMFGERMEKYGTRVYLINTGWTGGPHGEGKRINLPYTRAMVTAALTGEIEKTEFVHHDIFNVDVPQHIKGVPDIVLNPRQTWRDKEAYDEQARKLAAMFEDNAAKKYPNMEDAVREAGPHSK